MLRLAAVSLALGAVLFGVLAASHSPAAPALDGGPDALQAEIEALRPAKLAWREIRWSRCLLEGVKQSRLQKKPIFLWAFINADPTAERC